MKYIPFTLSMLFTLCFLSCEKEESLTGDKFYENYSIVRLIADTDRDIFLEGGAPINLSSVGFNSVRDSLVNIQAEYFQNDNPISGNTFAPTSTGTFRIFGLSSNEVKSNVIELESIMAADFESKIGFSDEYITLKTDRSIFIEGSNPINIEVSLTEKFIEQNFSNQDYQIIINDEVFNGTSFIPDQSGTFEIYARSNTGLTSNKVIIRSTLNSEFDTEFGFSDLFIDISTDKLFHIEGDTPIKIAARYTSEYLNQGFDDGAVKFMVNDQEISSEYLPNYTGVHEIYAVSPNGLKSNKIAVKAAFLQDISITTHYDDITLLTTNEWSISGRFAPTISTEFLGEFPIDNPRLKLYLDGEAQEDNGSFSFSQSGFYTFNYAIDDKKGTDVIFEVREETSTEIVEFPLVLHFYKTDRLNNETEIGQRIRALNEIVNNTDINFSQIVTNGDNPNKVDLQIRFFVKDINVIEVGNDGNTNFEQTIGLTEEHYWNPNQYINVYVTEGDWTDSFPFNPSGVANYASLSGATLPGIWTADQEPETPIINAIYMNGNLSPFVLAHEFGHLLSLLHNFDLGCEDHGDYVLDTYHYTRDENNNGSVVTNCEDNSVRLSNIMDYSGNGTTFTYDQRERIRVMIEYGLFIPTPNNLVKSNENKIVKGTLKYAKFTACKHHYH